MLMDMQLKEMHARVVWVLLIAFPTAHAADAS